VRIPYQTEQKGLILARKRQTYRVDGQNRRRRKNHLFYCITYFIFISCYSIIYIIIFRTVFQEHKKLSGLDELQGRYKYVQLCRGLKTYGVTFFLVKVFLSLLGCHFKCIVNVSEDFINYFSYSCRKR